jgi:putative nucleotidyltransferase with HDIG domain
VAELRLERLRPEAIEGLRAVLAAAPRGSAPMLVGGAVRDARLGGASRVDRADLDVAVESGALALARRAADRLGGAFVVLDARRGAARVVAAAVQVDVADWRAPTLAADLAERDYTVNALAVSVRDLLRRGRGRIIDPTGGLADLRAGRLRPPDARVLEDDPLRVLRGVRLEGALGFRLTPGTVTAIRRVAPALATVAAERVRDELLLVLALPASARALRRMDALGLLAVIVPEVEPMRATAQPAPHRFAVLEHSLRAVTGADALLARLGALTPFGDALARHVAGELGGGVTRAHVLKLAALLHDVAKPETRRVSAGRVRFHEHDTLGAVRARAIGERLRLPERAVGLLERLVRHHLRPMHLGAAGQVSRRARYRFYRDLGADTQDLLLLTLVDAAALTGASPFRVWRRVPLVRDLLAGWEPQHAVLAAAPLLRGGDVMARLGLPPGPAIGRLLARVREAQDLGRVRTREAALAFLDSLAPGP